MEHQPHPETPAKVVTMEHSKMNHSAMQHGECTWVGGSSCSFCFLQYWYGLAGIEEENKSAPFKKIKYFLNPKGEFVWRF